MLGEKISIIETICLLVSFAGVFVLTLNTEKTNRNDVDNVEFDFSLITAWILLIACPLLMAIGAIQTRSMKRLHEYTANFYGTVFGTFIFGIWM